MESGPVRRQKDAVKGTLEFARVSGYRLAHLREPRFRCPICSYHGPFREADPGRPSVRAHAGCPRCGSLERHRLQWLVLERLAGQHDLRSMRVLHFAPERFFRDHFESLFATYTTVDLEREGVDLFCDILALPFADASFDLVYASHVLEHVPDDQSAIAEIHRVLAPGGLAVLPVPFYGTDETVEYGDIYEYGHVRAPGRDYYHRYERAFSRVELHTSDDYPVDHQVYVYEDLSFYPNEESPKRPGVEGERHLDIVPICYA